MNKKMTTVALAAMAMALTTSCSTSKKAQNQVHEGTTSLEASKGNAENMIRNISFFLMLRRHSSRRTISLHSISSRRWLVSTPRSSRR